MVSISETQREERLVSEIIEAQHFDSLVAEINKAVIVGISLGASAATIDSALIYAAIHFRTWGESSLSNSELSEVGQCLAYQTCLFAKHVLGAGQSFPKLERIMATTEMLLD